MKLFSDINSKKDVRIVVVGIFTTAERGNIKSWKKDLEELGFNDFSQIDNFAFSTTKEFSTLKEAKSFITKMLEDGYDYDGSTKGFFELKVGDKVLEDKEW